jgi:putative ABC transport system permease protein
MLSGAYRLLSTFLLDGRYGLRMLLKFPEFTLLATLAIGLGIGATTTITSGADATLLRPLRFPNQDRLVVIFEQNPEIGITRASISPGNVYEWRRQSQTLEDVIIFRNRQHTLTGEGTPERYGAYGVSARFFDAIGVRPALGRTFHRGEEEPGNSQVVVLRYAFWQTRFGGDPKIIGKKILLDDKAFEVIGVAPKDFEFPFSGGEMWTPFVLEPAMQEDHTNHYLSVMGVVKPGVTVEQAGAELRDLSVRIQRQFPDQESGHSAYAVAINEEYTRGAKGYVPALLGSAFFVLLIACSNVANLLLARAAGRRKEIAVRLALGATRGRLMRQLLTESVMLGLLGGVLGCLVAWWGIEASSKGIPEAMARYIPGWSRLGLSPTVLMITAAISILTGVLFGLAPAWQATRTNLNETLKESGAAVGTSGPGRLRNLLAVVQLAVAMILLVGAGLFVRSFLQLLRADMGFDPRGVVAMSLGLPQEKYPDAQQRRNFFEQLEQRAAALPGVSRVGAIDTAPMSSRHNGTNFQIDGRPPFEKGKEPIIERVHATPGYFEAVGVRLRNGRFFQSQDDEKAQRVALVNEAFAARYLRGANPVGVRLRLWDAKSAPVEIVGVLGNQTDEDFDAEVEPCVYVPFAQSPPQGMTLILRTSVDHTQVIPALRNVVASIDPRLPPSETKTMEQAVYERRSPKEMMMWMLVVFGAIALAMAAVGTYAVVAYSVSERTHEIGVRIALGATPRGILQHVFRRSSWLILLGLGAGLAGAFALTRLLGGLLYGITATDPLTFVGVTLLMLFVAVLACYRPARRAAKVDPIVALRQ